MQLKKYLHSRVWLSFDWCSINQTWYFNNLLEEDFDLQLMFDYSFRSNIMKLQFEVFYWSWLLPRFLYPTCKHIKRHLMNTTSQDLEWLLSCTSLRENLNSKVDIHNKIVAFWWLRAKITKQPIIVCCYRVQIFKKGPWN